MMTVGFFLTKVIVGATNVFAVVMQPYPIDIKRVRETDDTLWDVSRLSNHQWWYGFAAFFLSAIITPTQVLAAPDVDLRIISQIESSGRANAYNPNDPSYGLHGITPTVLKEWNDAHPKERYGLKALYNERANTSIAYWYINKRLPYLLRSLKPVTLAHISDLDLILIAYNMGPTKCRKWFRNGALIKRLPKTTQNYLTKYHKLASDVSTFNRVTKVKRTQN